MSASAFPIPPIVDAASVAALRADLVARRGADLELDAAQVQRIGGLGLQVLIAAARAWRDDGRAFAIASPSAAFTEMLRLTGAADLPELQP